MNQAGRDAKELTPEIEGWPPSRRGAPSGGEGERDERFARKHPPFARA